MVYFHADASEGTEPEFPLPAHVHDQLQEEAWSHHMDINLGRLPLSPVDWVDQVQHSHAFRTVAWHRSHTWAWRCGGCERV